MNYDISSRLIMSVIRGIGVSYWVKKRYRREFGEETYEDIRPKYSSEITGSFLVMALPWMIVLESLFYDLKTGLYTVFGYYSSTFLLISVYYIILLPFIPALRKYIGARTVAMLWIIPNYLYITFLYEANRLSKPLYVISLPENLFSILLIIWFSGFFAVMLWNILQHLSFRRYILADAVPVTDRAILEIWQQTISDAKIKKPKFSLVYSDKATTPLSIGLFQRTLKVVLPYKSYTKEELQLIFKHEIIHISREDGWSKFFMVFCTAMCWFNPFMRSAMKKCAEDIELGCDEAVLNGADHATRKKYASLILETVGDERGFTTCLSASAKALLYRLTNITKPAKRTSGAIVLGLVFFTLSLTNGLVAMAYNEKTGAEYIFTEGHYSAYDVDDIYLYNQESMVDYNLGDEDALLKYFSQLRLLKIEGRMYKYPINESISSFNLSCGNKHFKIYLYDDAVKLTRRENRKTLEYNYHAPDGIDTEYINRLIGRTPFPELKVNAYTKDGDYVKSFKATLARLSKTENGRKTVLYENDVISAGAIGVTGYEYLGSYSFELSHRQSKPFKVAVTDNITGESRTFEQRDITQSFAVERDHNRNIYYTVYAEFCDGSDIVYTAEFAFNKGYMSMTTVYNS